MDFQRDQVLKDIIIERVDTIVVVMLVKENKGEEAANVVEIEITNTLGESDHIYFCSPYFSKRGSYFWLSVDFLLIMLEGGQLKFSKRRSAAKRSCY